MEDLLWGGLANIDNSTKVGRGVMGTSGLETKPSTESTRKPSEV